MVKEKRILSYVLGWLIVGFIIIFIGVNNVFASTYYMNYEYLQKYYDNYGSSVTAVTTTWNESLQSYISDNIGTTANSYGAGLSISSPIPILENHTYTLSIYFENINNVALSSKNHIAISTGLSGAATNYANGNYYVNMVQSNVNSDTVLQFVFTAKGHGSFIFIPWTTTYNTTQSYVLTQITMEDLGSEGISQSDINNSLNNQTNILNSSIQNSTDTITGEIDDMESAIIDSNKETQEVIKDQFNSCRDSYNLLDLSKLQNGYDTTHSLIENGFNAIGSLYVLYPFNVSSGTYTLKYDYKINSGNISSNTGKFRLRYTNGDYSIFYNSGSSFTINQELKEIMFYTDNGTETINIDFSNIMLQKGGAATNYEPYGEEICSNKIDETNDKLNGIQGALTDSSDPDTSDLENSAGWLPAGPLDSILNLPLTMLNSLTNSLGKTCSPLSLTLPYVNKNIQIPCLSSIFAQITGVNSLWTWVGTIASVLILYNYLLNLYAWVDRVLTLRAEFDEAMGADLANWGRL